MLILGVSMIFVPELMEDFANMFLIFLIAIIITFLLNYIYNNFRIKKIKPESEAQVIEVAEETEKLPMKKSARKKAKNKNKKKGTNKK